MPLPSARPSPVPGCPSRPHCVPGAPPALSRPPAAAAFSRDASTCRILPGRNLADRAPLACGTLINPHTRPLAFRCASPAGPRALEGIGQCGHWARRANRSSALTATTRGRGRYPDAQSSAGTKGVSVTGTAQLTAAAVVTGLRGLPDAAKEELTVFWCIGSARSGIRPWWSRGSSSSGASRWSSPGSASRPGGRRGRTSKRTDRPAPGPSGGCFACRFAFFARPWPSPGVPWASRP